MHPHATSFPDRGGCGAARKSSAGCSARSTGGSRGNEFPRGGSGVLREGLAVMEKHAVIATNREHYLVMLMCATLGIPLSGFHAHQARSRVTSASRLSGPSPWLRPTWTAHKGASSAREEPPHLRCTSNSPGAPGRWYARAAKKLVATLMREDWPRARRKHGRRVGTTHSARGTRQCRRTA